MIIVNVRSRWNVLSCERSVINDFERWYYRRRRDSYLESSENWFSFILNVSESGLTVIDLRIVCYSVWTVFFVTFESLVTEGARTVSQIVLDFGMCFDLRKSISEIDLHDEIYLKAEKRHVKTENSWHVKKTHFHHRRVG